MKSFIITSFIFITVAERVTSNPLQPYLVHPRCAKACSEMLIAKYPFQNLCCFYARWKTCLRTYTTCESRDMSLWIDMGCNMCKTTHAKWDKGRKYFQNKKWKNLLSRSKKYNKGLKF